MQSHLPLFFVLEWVHVQLYLKHMFVWHKSYFFVLQISVCLTFLILFHLYLKREITNGRLYVNTTEEYAHKNFSVLLAYFQNFLLCFFCKSSFKLETIFLYFHFTTDQWKDFWAYFMKKKIIILPAKKKISFNKFCQTLSYLKCQSLLIVMTLTYRWKYWQPQKYSNPFCWFHSVFSRFTFLTVETVTVRIITEIYDNTRM